MDVERHFRFSIISDNRNLKTTVKAGAGIKFHNCNDIEFNKMKYAIIAAGEGSRLVDEG